MTDQSTPVPKTNPLINGVKGLGDVSDIRTWITTAVVLGFFGAYILNWYRNDQKALDLMNGALIAQFTGAIGYWLGSSRGSDVKTAALVANSNEPIPPVEKVA